MSMERKLRIAGYVKLAKLWERNRIQALEYHRQYPDGEREHIEKLCSNIHE